MTLHRILGRVVIHACVKYQKKIFIGVGDIHADGQISDGRTDGAQIIIDNNSGKRILANQKTV